MKYDDTTALLLKIEISRLIQFYNAATHLQKDIIRKQLKILQFLLKKNQRFLQKKCKINGHVYSDWTLTSSLPQLKTKYKIVRICCLCGHCDIPKKRVYYINYKKKF